MLYAAEQGEKKRHKTSLSGHALLKITKIPLACVLLTPKTALTGVCEGKTCTEAPVAARG